MLHLPENLSVDEYVKENKVDELGTWATEVEIAATAGLLQTNIYCFAQFGNSEAWQKFTALNYVADASAEISDKGIYLQNKSFHFTYVKKINWMS